MKGIVQHHSFHRQSRLSAYALFPPSPPQPNLFKAHQEKKAYRGDKDYLHLGRTAERMRAY